jgi:hypothetical protein
MKTNRIFAIEFDGLIAKRTKEKYDIPLSQGDWKMDVTVREGLRRLDKHGHLMIHTRVVSSDHTSGDLEQVAQAIQLWLQARGYPFDYIWTGQGKPVAYRYIDTPEELNTLLGELDREEATFGG